jgi:hypothetical protein
MAYNSANLSVLAYSNGFTLWHYTTRDTAANLEAAGYFNKAADLLRVGDVIMANVDTAGVPAAGMFHVKSVSSSLVDVSNMTALNNT